jgi:hypothetical protein
MKSRIIIYLIHLSTVFTALVLVFSFRTTAFSAAGIDGDKDGLFTEGPPSNTVFVPGPSVSRTRLVGIKLSKLGGESGPPQDGSSLGRQISLNLFADTTLTAILDQVYQPTSGGFIWLGHLEEVENSHVILVYDQGVLIGKVGTPQSIYRVRYLGDGLQAVEQINLSAMPDELPPIPVFNAKDIAPKAASAADDGSVIDVLVVYTEQARSSAGGIVAIENEIKLAVTEANISYANSGINQRLVLTHMAEVTYTETGNANTDLTRLALTSDGYMDEVHPWRDIYHADNVHLVTQISGCGLGYLMTSVSLGFEDTAFSLSNRDCLTGNYTLPHELGHNMGARHDWYMDNATTPYTHAHGFANPAGMWRTVMAYNNLCDDAGIFCTRLLYWSNPDVDFGGTAMGVPAGTSTVCTAGSMTPDPGTCDADNQLTLDNTAPTTAQFRSSQITWTGDNSTEWNHLNNWIMVEGAPGSTTEVNRLPRVIDDVLIPSSPSGGRLPSISNGEHYVRSLTIEDGASLDMNGGTLNVYGDWEEQGTGVFNASAGTVAFVGSPDQSISLNDSTYFNHLQIGDGASTLNVNLLSDIELNGDLILQSEASLSGGSHTIRLAGDWIDNGTSFVSDTSSVILDGSTQTLSKSITSATQLDEPFEEADGGGCCSTLLLPTGWQREHTQGLGWLGGDYANTTGAAFRWNNSPDAWLFSAGFNLKPDVIYQVSFDYRLLFNGGANDFSLYIGGQQNSSSMTQLISSASSASTSYATQTNTFTVSTSSTYYLGIRAQQTGGSSYAVVDDILITSSERIVLYNLQVLSSDGATLTAETKVKNDLTVMGGGQLDLGAYSLVVDGELSNNGTIIQTLDVPDGSTTRYLYIQDDAASTDKYYGVDITPEGSALGNTTVTVRGNQSECSAGYHLINRCFDLTPGSAQPATIRFWYLDSEKGAEYPSLMSPYHWNGGSWQALNLAGTPRGSVGSYHWVEAVEVSSYSPFGLSDADPSAPTTATLAFFTAFPLHGDIFLSWGTSLEVDTLGFNLYRATQPDGKREKLNQEIIKSAALGTTSGAEYQYLDTNVLPGVSYTYWLEIITLKGSVSYDPVSASGPYALFVPRVSN